MKWFFCFVLAAGGLAGWKYREQLSSLVDSPRVRSLPTRTVGNSDPSSEAIFATGFVEGRTESVDLRFEIAGRLEELLVAEGQAFLKGDVLAVLDSAVLKQRVIQAEADLALAKAQHRRLENAARPETRQVAESQVLVAQAEVDRIEDRANRIKRLFDRGAASEEEWKSEFYSLQTAKAKLMEQQALAAEVKAAARGDDLEVAFKQIEVAKAGLEHAKLMLAKAQIIAPSNGTVLNIAKETGELVDSSDAEPVLVFADTEVLRVRAYVEELHALGVSRGDSARVTVDGLPNQEFDGQIVACAPWMQGKQYRSHKPNELLDVKTREVLIELKDASQLVVGLPVEVTMTPRKQETPLFPSEESIETVSPVTEWPVSNQENEYSSQADTEYPGNGPVWQSLENPLAHQ